MYRLLFEAGEEKTNIPRSPVERSNQVLRFKASIPHKADIKFAIKQLKYIKQPEADKNHVDFKRALKLFNH